MADRESGWGCGLPADLRTRLKALAQSLDNFQANRLTFSEQMALGYELGVGFVVGQLAALLAESEPEADECPFPSPESSGMSGCPCNPIDGKCVYCGAPEISPDCEARAKLPLGHEFVGCYNPKCAENLGCHIHGCGQPRSAHKPK